MTARLANHPSRAARGVLITGGACMARALGANDIRINCLAPGGVITERPHKLRLGAQGEASITRMQRLPRRVEPSDRARAALFFGADDSRPCTGQDVIVDGGWV